MSLYQFLYLMLACHYINSNQLIAIFLLGGDVYRVIDKRANKPEGNADHENFGEEGWEEDESDGHDDDGQHYYLISL